MTITIIFICHVSKIQSHINVAKTLQGFVFTVPLLFVDDRYDFTACFNGLVFSSKSPLVRETEAFLCLNKRV